MPYSQIPHPSYLTYRPVLLAILDGFGESPPDDQNAVAEARIPMMDSLKAKFPHGLINASELFVGLPEGRWAIPK